MEFIGRFRRLKALYSLGEEQHATRKYPPVPRTCGHKAIHRTEGRDVERRSARRREGQKVIVTQANIGTVSTAMLGKLLRDRVERIWAFPSA